MVALELPVLGHAPLKRWGLYPISFLESRWAGAYFDQSCAAEVALCDLEGCSETAPLLGPSSGSLRRQAERKPW